MMRVGGMGKRRMTCCGHRGVWLYGGSGGAGEWSIVRLLWLRSLLVPPELSGGVL